MGANYCVQATYMKLLTLESSESIERERESEGLTALILVIPT